MNLIERNKYPVSVKRAMAYPYLANIIGAMKLLNESNLSTEEKRHQMKLLLNDAAFKRALSDIDLRYPAPLVCIETQATGTPLIATRVGGISEYADKVGVVLVERDDKLVTNLAKEVQRLLDNPDLCVKMGEANRKNALQYGTEGYFSRFCKIVNSIIGENR